MNNIFRPLLRKFVLVFFDDILVYSKSFDDHVTHLGVVFNILKGIHLYANHKKCQFSQEQIEYLDHIISVDGVAADAEKIRTMVEIKKY